MTPAITLTLDALNRTTPEAFEAALGTVFEHATWVAARAATLRPFATVGALHEAMLGVALAAPEAEQTAFLRGHPELAGASARRATMAAHSAAEQASLGLDRPDAALGEIFERLNTAYLARFGFPFIICVRRHTLASIIGCFEQRLHNEALAERRAAFAEIGHITRLRLAGVVEGAGLVADAGYLSTHVLDTAVGQPAAGMAIALFECDGERMIPLMSCVTNRDGRTDAPLIGKGALRIGQYELRFAVGPYFATGGREGPAFLDVVPVRFGVSDPAAHYHVPLLVSPGAYSTYRGS